ncbi:PucR family transcriptional regulator ligand-binding domain-containing protein, partial [uncultured Clostridium sp.]|uniref:PucR family transcriptional regulator ligand-binding domain-containing protein n=1 Tax=uncultured Clostridium sp. TaxID=59620 RepID=UPI0025E89A53
MKNTYTLYDFLSLKKYEKSIIMNSDLKTKDILIKHISVIEPPVGNFIRKNEMVLTTAVNCHDSEESLIKFIKELFSSGASVIAVAFENPNYFIPSKVIQFINEHNIPLIQLPWDYRFADIVEDVLAQLKHKEIIEKQKWESLQKKLLTAYLNEKGIDDAAEIISHVIPNDIIITDNLNSPLAFIHNKHKININSIHAKPLLLDNCITLSKIFIDNKTVGLVYIKLDNKTEYEYKEIFENYLNMPLSLWFNKAAIIASTKNDLLDDFTWKMAKGEIENSEEEFARGRNLGLRLNKNYLCIVGRINNFPCMVNSTREAIIDWVDTNASTIKKRIDIFKQHISCDLVYTLHLEYIIIYLEETSYDKPQNINKIIQFLNNQLTKQYQQLICSWGIGRQSTPKQSYNQMYKDAKLAADLCLKEKPLGNYYEYKDIEIYKLLSNNTNNIESLNISDKYLQNLIEYGKRKQIDLLSFFETFVENNC